MKTVMNILKLFLLCFFSFVCLVIIAYSFGVVASKEYEKKGDVFVNCDSAWEEFKVDMAKSSTDITLHCIGSAEHKLYLKDMEVLKGSIVEQRRENFKKEVRRREKQQKDLSECSAVDVLNVVVARYSEERTIIQTLSPEEFSRKFKVNDLYQPITEAEFQFSIYAQEKDKDENTICFSQLEVKFVSPDGKELVERKSVGWKMNRADGHINLVDFKF